MKKTETTYKVGDKVRLKSLSLNESYPSSIDVEMVEYSGKVVTINYAELSYNKDYCCYFIDEDHNTWTWNDEMIEGLATETITEIKLEGNMNIKIKDYKVDEKKGTVVVFFEDGDIQKAKCCEGDTYDFERGLEVCIMKHICGGAEKYRKVLKVADEQIVAVDKAKVEAEKRAEIKARQRAKRAAKRKLKAERKRAERIAEQKEAYLLALKEYNGDTEKAIEVVN